MFSNDIFFFILIFKLFLLSGWLVVGLLFDDVFEFEFESCFIFNVEANDFMDNEFLKVRKEDDFLIDLVDSDCIYKVSS